MLKSFLKHRPKQLLAVYVEPRQIEVLKAHRQWRSWQIDSTEKYTTSEGETVFEYLQRLNLRPRTAKGTALILFLPRSYYSFHREHYPAAIADQLEETLAFDWQENAFHENARSLHFSGPPVPVDRHLSVPIFSLQRDVYEKFQQALGSSSFQTFAVIPSALTYQSFFSSIITEESSLPLEILGRRIDPHHLEIYRFYNGALLDSMMIGKNLDFAKLFRESLHCTGGNGECQETVHIHLLCSSNEATEDYAREWTEENLSLKVHNLRDLFVSHWVKFLLDKDQIQTFDEPLVLKPWEVPKFVWVLLVVIVAYAALAFHQFHSLSTLQDETKALRKQNTQLETQWKPIEQLQTRIAKFQEDQKTLSEFNLEGYPLLEMLTLLTQITPDDTWLNYMSLRKGQLMLRGESKSAIKYLSELAKVEGFSDVRFASPVTRNPASDQERFNVQLQLDSEKLRKTLDSVYVEKMDEIDKTETEAVIETESPRSSATPSVRQIAPGEAVEEEGRGEDAEAPDAETTDAETTDAETQDEEEGQ